MIMVSACLVGKNCKYNGGNNYNEKVCKYLVNKEYITVCPECDGGLAIPRDPSEILRGRVYSKGGRDVTKEFMLGAQKTLEKALKHDVTLAILKQSSPSCGSGSIYDGSFTNKKISGDGMTAALLKKHGIKILTEKDFQKM